MLATISKGQQITIPAIIRDAFGLNVGSKVEIEKVGNKIVITPAGEELEHMFELAKKIKPKHKMSVEQMEEFNERMFR